MKSKILRMKAPAHYFLFIFLGFSHLGWAQSSVPPGHDWFLKDPETDSVQGIGAEKAYRELLNGQPSRTILVAVIDSGIDIDHEDLKDLIWTNPAEIPGNGIDDDKNGYIDDVHGWNFIGGKTGNVNEDSNELTREYVRLKKKFENIGDSKVPRKQKAEYEQYLKIKEKFEKLKEKSDKEYDFYKGWFANASSSIDTLKQVLQTDTLTSEKIANYAPKDPELVFAKGYILNMFRISGLDNSEDLLNELKSGLDHFEQVARYGYNENFDPREIVGDNYNDPYEKGYGNADVRGADAHHGTHVAGIIGANRNNNLGIKGIADNVKIMPVRTVPNGDERDKDVANAIIYAVDNGAKVINMSFGKSYSPQKAAVDKAVKYAEKKGVLLVHAAGNDAENTDITRDFPTRYYLDGKEAQNWIEVGASSSGARNELAANFSNFGKKTVDLFAPGEQIYSTVPDNGYKNESGTSMASPVVAGVAALLMSYFPDLSVAEVRTIILNSSRKFDHLKVIKPGGKGAIEFSELSRTGGIVNVYEAVKMARAAGNQKVIK